MGKEEKKRVGAASCAWPCCTCLLYTDRPEDPKGYFKLASGLVGIHCCCSCWLQTAVVAARAWASLEVADECRGRIGGF